MKAIIWTNYGPPEVLQLKEVEAPTPRDNEVRIRIHATTVTAGDCELRALKLPFYLSLPMRLYVGFTRPTRVTIPGMELAGEIESAGRNVTRFRPGDRVFGATGFGMGAYAETICLPEEPGAMEGVLAEMPASSTYEEAAAVPVGGLEALHFLRQAHLRSGEKVLINGAGGSIGTFAVQLARHYGAEVTAVDSTGKLEMLRSIGADHVIDYNREDFTQSGEAYDVIFDVAGKSSYSRSLRSLKPNGRYLLANPRPSHRIRGPWTSAVSGKKVIVGSASYKTEALVFLKELIEAGKIKAVIDRCYPLEQAAEAHRYVETGQKSGNVVITVGNDDRT
jgi:2-desacetyl-2-hydroxyethyl bacteriochlorophyllide A dehydrogenase